MGLCESIVIHKNFTSKIRREKTKSFTLKKLISLSTDYKLKTVFYNDKNILIGDDTFLSYSCPIDNIGDIIMSTIPHDNKLYHDVLSIVGCQKRYISNVLYELLSIDKWPDESNPNGDMYHAIYLSIKKDADDMCSIKINIIRRIQINEPKTL